MLHFTVTEHARIRRATEHPDAVSTLAELYLPDDLFESLKTFIRQYEADAVLTYAWHRSREQILVRQYVGIIEMQPGVQLEILPKLTRTPVGEEPVFEETIARQTLLIMLRHLRDGPFRHLDTARLGAARLPLWEALVTAFLNDAEPIIRQGIQAAYLSVETTETYLRGKLRLTRQVQKPPTPTLALSYADRRTDVAANRLLKSALLYVQRRTRRTSSQARIWQMLFALDDVPPSARVERDMEEVSRAGRLFDRYEPALAWARVFLKGYAPSPVTGSHRYPALLFPMERVFEEYVAAGFRRFVTDGEVTIQEMSRHLIDEHQGRRHFRLRPDIILRRNGQLTVLDTKWQVLDETNETGNYGIESADMYQLFAYGKKYGSSELVLIYPATNTFREPLETFGYDENLRLRVVPFDLTQPLEREVRKLIGERV